MLTKIGTKLNKNNKNRNQIEYRILTVTWTFKKIKKKIKRK